MDLINPNASKECIIHSLQWCVKMGHGDILQALLLTHFSNNKLSEMSDICSDLLIRVVSDGSRDLLELLLPYVDEHFLANENNIMGKNHLSKMLCHGVTKGKQSIVELLINKGANVNTLYEGKPLLHVALQTGRLDMAKVLITKGASVDTALIPAISSNSNEKEEITDLLLHYGADPTLSGASGKQPIHVAAAHSAPIVHKLADVGCDVNTQDPIHRDTPLHIACAMCNTETVETLIRRGAKFNLINNQGETPLFKLLKFATNVHDFHSQSRLKLAKFLITIGFKLNLETEAKKKNSHGRNKVADVYRHLLSSSKCVFTLQHLCRLNIRDNIFTKTINKTTESLHLPQKIVRYLKFEDDRILS